MKSSARADPPLSPVMLAGFGLRPLPPAALQPLLDAAMVLMRRRHAGLFRRLSALADANFRIDPTDLPFDFLLRPGPNPRLRAVASGAGGGDEGAPTAVIHGSLAVLLRLLQGRLDGDALFFTRDLVVEGDTEAVVTLRNAIDGAAIDLFEDAMWMLGPLASPARAVAGRAAAVAGRLEDDLALLRRALLAPVAERCQAQAAELAVLRAQLAEIQRKPRARRPAIRENATP